MSKDAIVKRVLSLSESGEIADLSVSGFTLEEIIKELKLPTEWLNDYEVIEHYMSGLSHLYLTQKFTNASDAEILKDERITQKFCDEWALEFEYIIEEEKARLKEIDREDARLTSNPLKAGVSTVKKMNSNVTYYAGNVIERDVKMMVKKMQAGDTTDILTVLTAQVMQLQTMGDKIAGTVASSNRYDIMSKFQNLHLKTMNETRKTVMAINEIANPKRTTFIKTATQNNLQIENSNKKDIPNELSQPKGEIIDAYQYTETEETTIRENKEG